MLRYLLIFTACFGIVNPIFAQEPVKAKGRKVAFLVGVNNYAGSGFRCLLKSEQDIEILSLALKGSGYDKIVILSNSEIIQKEALRFRPRAQNILIELEEFCKTLTEDDTVLFAYAGHSGIIKKDRAVGLQLFPLEVRVNRPETMIPLQMIYDILGEKCKAKHKVIFIAPCRANPTDDEVIEFRLAQTECPELPQPPKSVYLVSACKVGTHSRFDTPFFLDVADCLSGYLVPERGKFLGGKLLEHLQPLAETKEKIDYVKGDLKGFENIEFATSFANPYWGWCEYAYQNRQVIFEKNTPKAVALPYSSDGKLVNYTIVNPSTNEVIVREVGTGFHCEDATFSHDGKQIAIIQEENVTVLIADAQTGKTIHKIKHELSTVADKPNRVSLIRYSEDNKIILTGDKFGNVILTSIADKKEVFKFQHRGAIKAASFSSGNQLVITVGDDLNVCAWSLVTGKKLWTTTMPQRCYCMTLSPLRNEIAIGTTDGKLLVINALTGRETRSINPKVGVITFLYFAPSGKQVLLCGSSSGTIYDIDLDKSFHEFEHERYIAHAAISPDGRTIATCSPDGFVKLWNAENGRCKHSLHEKNSCVHVAFSPDGKILVGVNTNWEYYIWNVETGKRLGKTIEKKKE